MDEQHLELEDDLLEVQEVRDAVVGDLTSVHVISTGKNIRNEENSFRTGYEDRGVFYFYREHVRVRTRKR